LFEASIMEFDMFVIIATVVVIVLIFSISQGRRNPGWPGQQRVCGSCGAAHPPFAQFCRRCGQRL
jgi:hypothetical protein